MFHCLFSSAPGWEMFLDQVKATYKSYDKYPDNQCSGGEVLLLEVLNYCNSHSPVKQMIAPPLRFNTQVLWSNLRVFTLASHDKEWPAFNLSSLEELYLASLDMGDSYYRCGVLVTRSKFDKFLNEALQLSLDSCTSTIFQTCMYFPSTPFQNVKHNGNEGDFKIIGRYPFRGCLDQD